MSRACTPVLMGVASSVSEIWLPFKNSQISPWSSKNLIVQNQIKKFMQVGVYVQCMHTNFGGCDLFGFGDITIILVQFSLSDHGGQQIESADIVQHLVVDEMLMYTYFGCLGFFFSVSICIIGDNSLFCYYYYYSVSVGGYCYCACAFARGSLLLIKAGPLLSFTSKSYYW